MRNQTRITILVAIFGLMFCISIASNNLLIDTQENTSQTTETIEELYFKKPVTAKSWWDNFSYIHIKMIKISIDLHTVRGKINIIECAKEFRI